MSKSFLIALISVVLVTLISCVPASPSNKSPIASVTKHFTVNLGGDFAGAAAAGYNVLDTGPSVGEINGLPNGTQSMVWLGNLDNSACSAGYTFTDFKAQVDSLATNPKVYGFFISDEAHPATCATAVTDIRERADYIHAVAPGKKAFIVILNSSSACTSADPGCEYAALSPANTHVDLVGVDPYPCHLSAPCDLTKITTKYNLAKNAGIPDTAIVPTFQTFGQAGGYYRLPTAAELQSMLDLWQSLLPNPVMDYSYTWGTQGSSPEALSTSPDLVQVMKKYIAGQGGGTTTTTTTPTTGGTTSPPTTGPTTTAPPTTSPGTTAPPTTAPPTTIPGIEPGDICEPDETPPCD